MLRFLFLETFYRANNYDTVQHVNMLDAVSWDEAVKILPSVIFTPEASETAIVETEFTHDRGMMFLVLGHPEHSEEEIEPEDQTVDRTGDYSDGWLILMGEIPAKEYIITSGLTKVGTDYNTIHDAIRGFQKYISGHKKSDVRLCSVIQRHNGRGA